ncbi:hypothetical protein BGZ83_001634, partial [Gryganskiella cystojenkinii]
MKYCIPFAVFLFLVAIADASPVPGHAGPGLSDVDGGSSNVGLMGAPGTANKVANVAGMPPGTSKPSSSGGGMFGAVGQAANIAGKLPGGGGKKPSALQLIGIASKLSGGGGMLGAVSKFTGGGQLS